ncbi:gp37 [Corynebacterium phage BFK20]|uniref:Gp37 n=1 Tax=Corynebacterium phage BFK20 TaxID=28358 RepID=Q3V5F8_9CAUD|nr:nucleotide kinase [Corynebacterium phage BFK20]CAJ29720.1 gp37 [Corynebacterium phage BFK20]
MTEDMVNHPPHYTSHPIFTGECWSYAQTLENGAEFSAFRYAFRYADKHNPVQDVEKALWYLDQIIDNFATLQPVNVRLDEGKAPWSIERAGAIQEAIGDISDSESFESASYADQVAAQACLEILLGLDPDRARTHLENLRRELTGEVDEDETDAVQDFEGRIMSVAKDAVDWTTSRAKDAMDAVERERVSASGGLIEGVNPYVQRESVTIPPRDPENPTFAQKWRNALRGLK